MLCCVQLATSIMRHAIDFLRTTPEDATGQALLGRLPVVRLPPRETLTHARGRHGACTHARTHTASPSNGLLSRYFTRACHSWQVPTTWCTCHNRQLPLQTGPSTIPQDHHAAQGPGTALHSFFWHSLSSQYSAMTWPASTSAPVAHVARGLPCHYSL